MFHAQNQQMYNLNFTIGFTKLTFLLLCIRIPQDSRPQSQLVGLMARNTTSSLLRGNIVVDRENIDIAVRQIPGHHGYLEDLKVRSRHDRPVDLASNASGPAAKGRQ